MDDNEPGSGPGVYSDDPLGLTRPGGWQGAQANTSAPSSSALLASGGSTTAPATSPAAPHTLLAYARNPTPPQGEASSGFLSVAPHADVANLSPEFARRAAAFQRAAKEAGVDTTVLSGYRDNAKQAQLYAAYKNGTGGIAAPPGMSYHNSGNAMDLYASDPAKQKWLVENAPKFGLYPGANFGDPGHFQIAGANPGGDHVGETKGMQEVAQGGTSAPLDTSEVPAASPAELFSGQMKLALLRNMFPQHNITQVEYDPYAVMPKGDATKRTDVNQGVG